MLFSTHQLDLGEDLCEDVVIVDHGRIVLAGALEELRAAVPQWFVDIRYRGGPPDWSALPAVAVVEAREGGTRLRLDCDTALATVVAFARRTPGIVSLTYGPPTLAELFRQAVAP